MKAVLCVWEDASDLDEGPWTPRKDAAKPEATIFHQIGYLYELTADAVVLTACVGQEQMGVRSRIPAGMVRSLVELNEGQPVKIPKRRTKKVRGD
jgi:hypothetical protein